MLQFMEMHHQFLSAQLIHGKRNCQQLTVIKKISDIFNVDELGLFYQLLPNKTHVLKGKSCRSGKHSKVRITVLLGANADGSQKLKPLVIGKYENPRVFKNINKNKLPVYYRFNKKAWMTGGIFKDYISILNKQMVRQDRKILLFLDNCPAHPNDLKFSNIKFVFFPPNTTSVCQPMDQGIIKVFKGYYRNRVVEEIFRKTSSNNSINADQIKISLLDAIFFIDQSWKEVDISTISNCFKHAGFHKNLSKEADVTENNEAEFEEFLNADNNLAVAECEKTVQNRDSDETEIESGAETDTEDVDIQIPTFSDICKALDTLRKYSYVCDTSVADKIDSLQRELTIYRQGALVQTKITQFFKNV
jgi:DDE superfamily endonuclease